MSTEKWRAETVQQPGTVLYQVAKHGSSVLSKLDDAMNCEDGRKKADMIVALFSLGGLCGIPTECHVEDESETETNHGIVKWFNDKNGFGLIINSQGEEVFVHYRSIRLKGSRRLATGQRVEYQLEHSSKGLRASKVVPECEVS